MALWGVALRTQAETLRTEPNAIRGDEKAVFVSVSGGVLLLFALALAVLALGRVVRDDDAIPPPVISMLLGATMIGLFVVFSLWGISLTKSKGMSAATLLVMPYFIGGVAVLFGRRHRLERRVPAQS